MKIIAVLVVANLLFSRPATARTYSSEDTRAGIELCATLSKLPPNTFKDKTEEAIAENPKFTEEDKGFILALCMAYLQGRQDQSVKSE